MSNERNKLRSKGAATSRERIAGCARGVSSRCEDGDQPTSNPLELSANLLHVDENRACGSSVLPCSCLHPSSHPSRCTRTRTSTHARAYARRAARRRLAFISPLALSRHVASEIDESSSEMRVHRARPAESIGSIFAKRHTCRREGAFTTRRGLERFPETPRIRPRDS